MKTNTLNAMEDTENEECSVTAGGRMQTGGSDM